MREAREVPAQPGAGVVLAQKSVLPRLEALAEPWSAQAVSLACICWYLVRALHKRPARARHRALYRHLLAAYGALQDRLGAVSASLRPSRRLHKRHRASSAIEGFNAALRPYLWVHKGATQGFLGVLVQSRRRWGRHKVFCQHSECLTGQRVHDWLTLLGCPPFAAHCKSTGAAAPSRHWKPRALRLDIKDKCDSRLRRISM